MNLGQADTIKIFKLVLPNINYADEFFHNFNELKIIIKIVQSSKVYLKTKTETLRIYALNMFF